MLRSRTSVLLPRRLPAGMAFVLRASEEASQECQPRMAVETMSETTLAYFEYSITVTQADGRFIARVSREGGLIEHDGQVAEAWSSASCPTSERAIQVAKTAIDT